MPETVPVKLVIPASPDSTPPGLAVEDGVEYVPSELCASCFAVVPQAKADAHAATHPAPPPEVTPM
jgi:hypothetical protein